MLCGADAACLPGNAVALDLFDDEDESVYEHYNAEIRHHIESGRVFEDMKRRIRELEAGAEKAPAAGGFRAWLRRLLGRR